MIKLVQNFLTQFKLKYDRSMSAVNVKWDSWTQVTEQVSGNVPILEKYSLGEEVSSERGEERSYPAEQVELQHIPADVTSEHLVRILVSDWLGAGHVVHLKAFV